MKFKSSFATRTSSFLTLTAKNGSEEVGYDQWSFVHRFWSVSKRN